MEEYALYIARGRTIANHSEISDLLLASSFPFKRVGPEDHHLAGWVVERPDGGEHSVDVMWFPKEWFPNLRYEDEPIRVTLMR